MSNEKLPLVTVVVPCYNHSKFVGACIESIIDQDYKNIELIIINDGSKDRSSDEIRKYIKVCEERFLRFTFIDRLNKGLCFTLNEGIRWAKGTFICFLASDDLILPNSLSLRIKYSLKYNDVCSFYGGVKIIDENNKIMFNHETNLKFYSFKEIFTHNFILYAPTAMHKLHELKEIGGFDENVKIEDWELWLRLTKNNKKILCIPEMLACYRHHGNNMSMKNQFMHKELLNILYRYKDEKLFKKARYNITKQYIIRPIKSESFLRYCFVKTYFYFKYLK